MTETPHQALATSHHSLQLLSQSGFFLEAILKDGGEASLAKRQRGDAEHRGERNEDQGGIDEQTAPLVLANFLEPCRCLDRKSRRESADLTDDRVTSQSLRTDRCRKIRARELA